MTRYSIKRNRKKAQFGAEAGAILAAAGIQVAGNLAAAGMQASAAKDAAKQQADSMKNSAKIQSDAILRQTENYNSGLEKQFAFTKEQNAEANDIQKNIQMNIQMLAGGQNHNDRLEANKIQVRNGGSLRRKCLQGSAMQSSLRAGNKLDFKVTDGGAVQPMFATTDGGQMYQIKGNTHDQYHKTKNGYKSGVGIEFENGDVVEGEGDGSSPKTLAGGGQLQGGEGLYIDPSKDDALFISQHGVPADPEVISLTGGLGIKNNKFVPMLAVEQGLHPRLAFTGQEISKHNHGITDSGKEQAKYGKRKRCSLGGLNSFNIKDDTYSSTVSNTDFDNMFSGESNFVANMPEINNRFKLGGRKKAKDGFWTYTGSDGKKYLSNSGANIIGGTLTGLGNIGGALISNWGLDQASSYLIDAYRRQGDIIADAYSNLRGIDYTKLFNRKDFQAAHVMPALETARYNVNPQLARIERARQRQLGLAKNSNVSAAAMQDRSSNIEVNSADQESRVFDAQQKAIENIKGRNIASLNRAAEFNAQADIQSSKNYIDNLMAMHKYNTDIYNRKMLGIANAKASSIAGIAQTEANNMQTIGNTWAGVTQSIGSNLGSILANNAKMRYDAEQAAAKHKADLDTAMIGADSYGRFKMDIKNNNFDSAVDEAILTSNIDYAKKLASMSSRLTEEQRTRLYNKFGDSMLNKAKYGTNIGHKSLKR